MNGGGSRGSDGRFTGVRLHVEAVPRLPTFPARRTLDDPRGRPYFVFWTTRHGKLDYHLRMAKLGDGRAVVVATPEGRHVASKSSTDRCRGVEARRCSIVALSAYPPDGTCTHTPLKGTGALTMRS